jgi:NSS family neurotransmitter:Na+ symporter
MTKNKHSQWSSQLGFVLAAIGSAVGLGNIWKFPYLTGEYGGGAFVIIYLLCVVLMGLPIMIAEVLLGKRGAANPVTSMRNVAKEAGQSPLWQLLGWSGVIAGFLILSYYSVIAGWTLDYIWRSASGTFSVVNTLPTNEINPFIKEIFTNLISNPIYLLILHSIFMLITIIILAGGVQGGLERAVTFMIPALFIVLIMLVGYAISTPKFMDGVHFMFDINFHKFFYPDGENFSGKGILVAMGQAFFSLSLGMGAIMVYGAYLPKDSSIAKTTTIVAMADALVAILAGLIIFPIVFSNGLEPNAGVGLVFQTLPIAFGQMPFGSIFGSLFFILLTLAALSSAISLIEPAIAWLVETGKFARLTATIIVGIATWLFGFLTIFSFNEWSEFKVLSLTMFELIDYITSNIMLPLGGILMAIFVAWLMKSEHVTSELKVSPQNLGYQIWNFLLRYIIPLAVTLVLLNAIGIFS